MSLVLSVDYGFVDECGLFSLLSVVYRISFASHCGHIGVGPKVTGDIRTHLTGCIRTHHLEHLPVTLEVVDTKIKVTCFTWGAQSNERSIATHSSSIVINAFFFHTM